MVGMTCFVLMLALGIKKSMGRYKDTLSPYYACFVAIFVFSLLQGILESSVTAASMLSFIVILILVHLGFCVSRSQQEPEVERMG
jgi:hypothetical protein